MRPNGLRLVVLPLPPPMLSPLSSSPPRGDGGSEPPLDPPSELIGRLDDVSRSRGSRSPQLRRRTASDCFMDSSGSASISRELGSLPMMAAVTAAARRFAGQQTHADLIDVYWYPSGSSCPISFSAACLSLSISQEPAQGHYNRLRLAYQSAHRMNFSTTAVYKYSLVGA